MDSYFTLLSSRKFNPFILLCFILFLSACTTSQTDDQTASQASSAEVTEESIEPTEEINENISVSTTNTLTIRSIGDLLIHDYVYYDAVTTDGYNFLPMLEPIQPYLESADITTANLEVLVAGEEFGLSSYPLFNAPDDLIDDLQAVGVDIVTNANNHTMDFGSAGAHASIANLQDKEMMYVGSYESWDDYNNLRIIEENGISVGFLAYAEHVNGNYIPENEQYLISLIDTELIPLEVDYLNQQVDFSVVMLHYGEEGATLPNQSQLNISSIVRDAGANLIIGTHPHVLQPAIVYNDQQAGVFSLGNFLSGQIQEEEKLGGIIEFNLIKAGDNTAIDSVRLMPTYNLGSLDGGNYQVVPLADWEEYGIPDGQALYDRIYNRMRVYSNQVEVVDYLD